MRFSLSLDSQSPSEVLVEEFGDGDVVVGEEMDLKDTQNREDFPRIHTNERSSPSLFTSCPPLSSLSLSSSWIMVLGRMLLLLLLLEL